MSVSIVFETHSTSEDNENGIATGWLPGRLSVTGRAQAAQLVIGHVATRWGLEHLLAGELLEDLVRRDFAWQPGWEYHAASG